MIGYLFWSLVSVSPVISWSIMGHRTQNRGITKAAAQFRELNAFDASMSSMALVSLVSNILYMAYL